MKLLFVVPYAPNLIRVRPYQLLRALVQRGHQITLATLWSNEEERADLNRLANLGIELIARPLSPWRSLTNVARTLPTAAPLQSAYCWQPELATMIGYRVANNEFDAVHVEHLRGARYGLLAKGQIVKAGATVPVVWDSVDCISHLFAQAAAQSRSLRSRLMTRLDLARTRSYEGALVHQFDQITVTSPMDKAALEELAHAHPLAATNTQRTGEKVHVLPNGVDLTYFTPGSEPREQATILFSGKMSYHANITAALHLVQDIMPQVWATRPEVKVWLVGKDPAPEIRALATASAEQKPGTGQVVVTGTVPDLSPYLRQATLAVAPIPYGAGIQNKVLEAMACSVAVVASPQACSAIPVRSGNELIVANDADAFAQAILTLLARPQQRQQLGEAARRYVEAHHSWDAIARQLEQFYCCAQPQQVHTRA